jgi:hypothetical protein
MDLQQDWSLMMVVFSEQRSYAIKAIEPTTPPPCPLRKCKDIQDSRRQ